MDDLVAPAIHSNRHKCDQREQSDQHRCRQPGQIASRSTREETEPDAEKRTEQHKVREVAEVDDLRAELADKNELEEEHQPASEEHPSFGRPDACEPLTMAHRGGCRFGDHGDLIIRRGVSLSRHRYRLIAGQLVLAAASSHSRL